MDHVRVRGGGRVELGVGGAFRDVVDAAVEVDCCCVPCGGGGGVVGVAADDALLGDVQRDVVLDVLEGGVGAGQGEEAVGSSGAYGLDVRRRDALEEVARAGREG